MEIVLIFFLVILVLLLGEHLALLDLCDIVAHIGHDIGREVEHAFQNTGRYVEHQPHAGRDALEIPDVRNGRGKLDMAHALAAHLGHGDLHAAALADLALVAEFLVFAAVAFPVLGGAENAFAEQAVAFRLQGTVIDGLRFLDLAVGPLADHIRGRNSNFNRIKGGICHTIAPPYSSPSSWPSSGSARSLNTSIISSGPSSSTL